MLTYVFTTITSFVIFIQYQYLFCRWQVPISSWSGNYRDIRCCCFNKKRDLMKTVSYILMSEVWSRRPTFGSKKLFCNFIKIVKPFMHYIPIDPVLKVNINICIILDLHQCHNFSQSDAISMIIIEKVIKYPHAYTNKTI